MAVDRDETKEYARRCGLEELHVIARAPRLSPVHAHPFRLGENTPIHSTFQFQSTGSCLQVQRNVESIQFEEVSMRFAGRWAWAAIADAN
jgi:hypothetical protein